jgi:hypothetical protein
MSLESTLERIAASLEAIVVLQGGAAPAAKGPGRPPKAATPDQSVVSAPVADAKAAALAEPTATASVADASGKSPKLQEVSKAINGLITGGHRAKAVELLAKFGAKNASGLKEPDYDAVLDEVAGILIAA